MTFNEIKRVYEQVEYLAHMFFICGEISLLIIIKQDQYKLTMIELRIYIKAYHLVPFLKEQSINWILKKVILKITFSFCFLTIKCQIE
jgi:hypothetical protein